MFCLRTINAYFFGHTPASYISGENKILLYPRKEKPSKIKDYYGGVKWNLLDAETVGALLKDKSCLDEDLNRSNPGITIVIL